MIRRLAPLLLLSGCGLQPLYSGGSGGSVAEALAGVEVAPIPGKNGWLVANALKDRIAAIPDAAINCAQDVNGPYDRMPLCGS